MRAVVLLLAAMHGAAGQGTVAYVQGGDLWLKVLPSGEPKRLTTGGGFHRPRWSASGHWLSARQGEGLWLARYSGDGAREIAAGEAQWSPASDELAYIDESGRLRILEVATGREREVAPKAAAVQWSPDCRWLAFLHADTGALWRVGSDGAGAYELFRSEVSSAWAVGRPQARSCFGIHRKIPNRCSPTALLSKRSPFPVVRRGGFPPVSCRIAIS